MRQGLHVFGNHHTYTHHSLKKKQPHLPNYYETLAHMRFVGPRPSRPSRKTSKRAMEPSCCSRHKNKHKQDGLKDIWENAESF